jgi:SAM-dependent methyltransferase
LEILMTQVDGRYYEVATPGSVSEKLTAIARDRIYADFLRLCAPKPQDQILDVGVSDVLGDAANVLERRYALPDQVTAVGLGTGEDFKRSFPLIRYEQINANQRLPFKDGSFDVVTANAVLEHVGSAQNQKFLISEMLRVGGRVFVVVPHRYFPIEHHTAIPFLHWTDVSFRLACRMIRKEKWASQENLILMTRERLKDAFPQPGSAKIGMTGIMLGPWSSNLYLFAEGIPRQSH